MRFEGMLYDLNNLMRDILMSIQEFLEDQRMTQSEFCLRCGISIPILYRLMNCEPVSISTLRKVEYVLGERLNNPIKKNRGGHNKKQSLIKRNFVFDVDPSMLKVDVNSEAGEVSWTGTLEELMAKIKS